MTRHSAFRPSVVILEKRWLPTAAPYPDAFRNSVQQSYVAQADQKTNEVVFLGDSITFNWGTATRQAPGSATFSADFAPLGAANFGIYGDTTQNLLYRVEDGDLNGQPKVAVVMIGFNDLFGGSTPAQAASGVTSVVQAIQAASPETKVLLLGVLPSNVTTLNPEIQQLDALISGLGNDPGVTYLNPGALFEGPDGNPKPGLLMDLVHPDAAGYQLLANAIDGTVLELLDGGVSSTLSPANLVLDQSVYPSTGTVGSFQIFTMTVTNIGPGAATEPTLVDLLPANVTFINAAPSQGGFASLVNGVITDNFGPIAAGASASLTLVVAPKTFGNLVNFAGVYAPDVPSLPPSFALGAVSVPSGPSVIGVAGSGGNSKLFVAFDEALNSPTATNRANYKLDAIGKTGNGPDRSIAISSVAYNSSTNSVLITPSQALDPAQYYQLVLFGSTNNGIADTLGRRLVNPRYTTPGANFTVRFHAGTLPQV